MTTLLLQPEKVQELLFKVTLDYFSEQLNNNFLIINPFLHKSLLSFSKKVSSLEAIEGFFPSYRALNSMGIKSKPYLEVNNHLVLFLGGRIKTENLKILETIIASAGECLGFLACFPNQLGALSYEKYLQNIYRGDIFSVQKSKCRVFGLNEIRKELINHSEFEYYKNDKNLQIFSTTYFNDGQIDLASQLLINTVKDKLIGVGLESCCGQGKISYEITKHNPNILKVFAIDADYLSIELAKKFIVSDKIDFIWEDSSKKFQHLVDFVIINPPFHSKYGLDKKLGAKCIQAGIDSLKKDGIIYVVQSEFLPYQKELNIFGQCQTLAREKGFIVWSYQKN